LLVFLVIDCSSSNVFLTGGCGFLLLFVKIGCNFFCGGPAVCPSAPPTAPCHGAVDDAASSAPPLVVHITGTIAGAEGGPVAAAPLLPVGNTKIGGLACVPKPPPPPPPDENR
uniref:Secreted protein n=1 Tax=Haemonchus placei TaxID=6290 RepID=A0A0N4WKK5_HAEPC